MRNIINFFYSNKPLFYFILLSFLLTSCQKGYEKMPPAKAVMVSTRTVAYAQVPLEYTFPASIISGKQIDLRTDISGTIEGILFKEGSHVSKGQALYDIDKSRYKSAYGQAVAQWEVSKAQLEQAQMDAQRYKNLWRHDAVEKIKLDHAQSEVKVAQANVQAAKANADRIKADLSHATVKAPFSGYIGASEVRLGDMVISGQTVLTTLASKDDILADFFIPESLYKQIHIKENSVTPDFSLTLADGSAYTEAGRLKFIENQVNSSTGTLRVRVSFPNPKELLTSGMNAVIKIKQTREDPAILIDQKSIRKILNENFVFVIGENQKVTDRKIKIGPAIGNQQIVEKGLSAGEQIVTEGIQKIKSGDMVKVQNILPADHN